MFNFFGKKGRGRNVRADMGLDLPTFAKMVHVPVPVLAN
jgi:hypothetical protein